MHNINNYVMRAPFSIIVLPLALTLACSGSSGSLVLCRTMLLTCYTAVFFDFFKISLYVSMYAYVSM